MIRCRSIVLHWDETNERKTGLVCGIDNVNAQALILWHHTHIPHWCSMKGLVTLTEWKRQRKAKHRIVPLTVNVEEAAS